MRRRPELRLVLGAALLIGTLPIGASATAQTPQTDPKVEAARLLDALRTASNTQEATLLEAHIEALWAEEGSPAVRLLMSRGARELAAGADKDAIEDFGDALTLAPNLADAWRARAQARYAAGDGDGAVADLLEALRLEPHDFLAYRLLTDICVKQQDWKAALHAWQKLLAIDPKTADGAQRLRQLRVHALGQEM